VQQALLRRHIDNKVPPMRMYSPQELDVMAEAYERALEKAPREICSIATTQRLVQEIAWGVVNGLRDEEALANAALERTHIGETNLT
jgi:hypothetical protein